jgi:hypothetical protein
MLQIVPTLTDDSRGIIWGHRLIISTYRGRLVKGKQNNMVKMKEIVNVSNLFYLDNKQSI